MFNKLCVRVREILVVRTSPLMFRKSYVCVEFLGKTPEAPCSIALTVNFWQLHHEPTTITFTINTQPTTIDRGTIGNFQIAVPSESNSSCG